MKRTILATLAISFVALACGQGETGDLLAGGETADRRTVGVYEAVVRNLVAQADARGRRIYIWERLDPKAGTAMAGKDAVGRAKERLPEEDQRALEDRLRSLGAVEFISNPDSVMKQEGGVVGDGVLIRLGPIDGNGDKLKVPAGSYQGLLAGTWQTFVVEKSGGTWKVTGTTGPVAIS